MAIRTHLNGSLCLLAPLAALLAAAPSSAVAQAIPSPESVLGHTVGEDFFLATFEESLDYFEQLASASDRVELLEVGRTSFGRPTYVAFISSPENLGDLERYREISQRLAHPEGLSDEEARQLAREGKAIVHIDGGLHATEVAHAQHTMQLAYDLATEDDDPETLSILENVILMLWPSINPDGQTMVADWYRSNLGTPYEVSAMPWLYQKYVGHDNNRDGYMINMIESRMVTRVDRHWEPHILYNHHQTAPFPARIWIPPFAEPISPYVHPLMWRSVNLIGMAMAQALEERGQKGAMHMGTGFDNWYPGFMDHANNFHNVASLLTETGLYRYATPHFYTVNDFPERNRGLQPQSLYSSPWEGGWWRLRDAVDYMLTASVSVLDVASKYKEDLLYNRYQAGRDIIAQYSEGPPYGYFIPQDQRDPVAAVELLRRLAFNGIEVHQLDTAVTYDGIQHPAGTWVIAMDQPFANYVRQLFSVQDYPDLREFPEGPPDQPYDVAGWTLPYQMGVRVIEASSPLEDGVRTAMSQVSGETVDWDSTEDAALFDSPPGPGFNSHPVAAGIVPLAGQISGSGGALVLDPAQNNTFRALNRVWSEGGRVRIQPGAQGEEGEGGTSATYQVTGLSSAAQDRLASDFALQARRGGSGGTEISQPRIGVYRPWSPDADDGWTRWLLEVYGYEFTSLRNAEVRAGGLSDRFDVVIIADVPAGRIIDGFQKGSVPPRYAGGIGAEGVREIDEFVRTGGTLVTLNGGSVFAIDELHLPVENVVAELDRKDFFMSGSIVELEVDPSHPVMAGMESRSKVVVGRSPVFSVTEEFEGSALAKYPTEGSPLLSGYLLGEEHLQGYAAALDVEHGDGHVVLLGMKPQWRGQPFGNFRILFNAVLYSGLAAAAVTPNGDFWSAPSEAEDEDVSGEDEDEVGRR